MTIKSFLGEFIGTFILVLFGCGAVAGATLFGAFNSLLEVAWIGGWGEMAFPDSYGGWFWVYMLGPVLGGVMACFLFSLISKQSKTS